MPDRAVPRNLLVLLGLVAGGTFGLGIYLETTNKLTQHPYLVNLLSGITGFSASVLVAALLINRFVERARIRKWEGVIAYLTASINRRITAVSHTIALEHGLLSEEWNPEDVSVGAGMYKFHRTPSLANLEERLESAAGDAQTVCSFLSDHPNSGEQTGWIQSCEHDSDFWEGINSFRRCLDPEWHRTWIAPWGTFFPG